MSGRGDDDAVGGIKVEDAGGELLASAISGDIGMRLRPGVASAA